MKEFEMHYKMGEKKGRWKEWDPEGNLIKEKVY
jgi:antitoxin component YwqK of YwqJK toxin-antitoxin module